MGIQVAAIAKRYTLQMQAQAAKAQSADGTVQVGINLEKMMADQKATSGRNIKVFGVEKVENFTSMRTPEAIRLYVVLTKQRVLSSKNSILKSK